MPFKQIARRWHKLSCTNHQCNAKFDSGKCLICMQVDMIVTIGEYLQSHLSVCRPRCVCPAVCPGTSFFWYTDMSSKYTT